MTKDITVILGATGIGKSQLALTLAKEQNAHIISADAFQVYKGMDIGTAKVSKKEQAEVPHYLIDIKTPDQSYSVVEFLKKANQIIQDLRKTATPIIICGGTAFYLRAFLHHYKFDSTDQSQKETRHILEQRLKKEGAQSLWKELQNIDPEMAAIVDIQNHRRLIRALEIYHTTGKQPSSFRTHSEDPRHDCHIIGLTTDREKIYDRINIRVLDMIKKGFIEEVEALLEHYPENSSGFNALGYPQCIDYLKGSISKEEMIQSIQTLTRRFAKRQLTWYKRFKNVHWQEI